MYIQYRKLALISAHIVREPYATCGSTFLAACVDIQLFLDGDDVFWRPRINSSNNSEMRPRVTSNGLLQEMDLNKVIVRDERAP